MSAKEKILIIEDDPDTLAAMRITLETQGYEVSTADNPESGLEEARKCEPGLVILDVMFGSKETVQGFDCAVKIRKDKLLAQIPILMITAVNVKHPKFHFSPDADGEYLPVDDFIDKPAKSADLIRKVKKLLELKTSKWVNWPEASS